MLPRRIPATWAVTALATAAAAGGVLGADLRWTVPVGDLIAHGSLPRSIPFASAPSADWHDAPALGQLVLWALYSVGEDRALLLAQIAAAGLAWALLACGLRRHGSSEGTAALVAFVVFVGCLPVVAEARVWLFSLALFPVLLLLLESESRTPSRRIYLVVPLLALWSNLYGGALVGWVVVLLHLAAARRWREPWTPLLLAGASTLALSLTPVLWKTAAYYREALGNEAAKRGYGVWAPLRPHGYEIVVIAVGVVLLVLAVRGRPLLWEWAALVALAAGTIHAWRFAPYLLFAAAYPAGRALQLSRPPRAVTRIGFALFVALTVEGLAIAKQDDGSRPLARQAAATGLPVLAEPIVAEQVELNGGRVWLANPLDAFSRHDQDLWLDWITGKPAGSAAIDHARLVIVGSKTKAGRAAARDPRLALVRADGDYVLYRVRLGVSHDGEPVRRARRTRVSNLPRRTTSATPRSQGRRAPLIQRPPTRFEQHRGGCKPLGVRQSRCPDQAGPRSQSLRAWRRLRIVQPVVVVRSRPPNTTSRGRSPARTFSVIAIWRPRPRAK